MVISQRIAQVMDRLGPVAHFFTASAYARRAGDPGICDFAVGNPHELPLQGFVDALGRYIVLQNNAWFGYKGNESGPCEVVATALRERRGLPFEADDIFLTKETITKWGLRHLPKPNICCGLCWIPSLEASSQLVVVHFGPLLHQQMPSLLRNSPSAVSSPSACSPLASRLIPPCRSHLPRHTDSAGHTCR